MATGENGEKRPGGKGGRERPGDKGARERSGGGTARERRRRPGGRSARVREAVLRATLEELAAGGYASFSLEAVARRAGVNKTTVYRRWGTRETLILDAMLERGSELVPIPDTGSLEGDLFAYGKAIASTVTAPEVQAIVRAVASIAEADSLIVDASHRFWRTRLQLAREIVDRAVEREEIGPDADPKLVVELVIAPIYFRLLLSGEKLGNHFVKELARLAARAAGVRTTSAASRRTRRQAGSRTA
jgi:AcrR family transcriptional regulator